MGLSAARAYKQATAVLHALNLKPHSQHVFDAGLATPNNDNARSIFNSFLPNFQGQGPVGSAVRIVLKLHHLITHRVSSSFTKEGLGLGSKKREEDFRAKAIKALDLLEHSTELGNTDALYTLGLVSLVRFKSPPDSKVPDHTPSSRQTTTSTLTPRKRTTLSPNTHPKPETRPPSHSSPSSMHRDTAT
jgi:SEL1 protein